MAIGPELSPNLAKRKRDPDSESDSGSEKRKRTIGPSLPPPNITNPDALDLEDDSSEDDGPQPAKSIGPSLPGVVPVDEAPRPRVMGPAMPPSNVQNEAEDDDRGKEEDSESDDDIGPAPPPADGEKPQTSNPYEQDTGTQTSSQPAGQLQRDDWMLAAPSSGDWTDRVDPTKLRNRKFNTNARGAPATGSAGGDMWSETPEQKRQRLQNQVLGIGQPGQDEQFQSSRSTGNNEDREKERRIREYNEKHRGESLFNQHQGSRDKEEEDDPSKRAFDREKDIAGGTRISHAKKREMMTKASDFGSRFAKGSYL